MEPLHRESNVFRYTVGVLCILGGFASLAGLYFVEIPQGNREPILLAIGLVLGWGGSVVASEFGATTTGRKVADAAVRNIEQQTGLANEDRAAAGKLGATEEKPLPVETRTEAAAGEDIDAAPR
jgi:hypothetical protein